MRASFNRLVLPAFLLAAFLSGCASQPLYYWGNYESRVYAFLKGESRETQMSGMQEDAAKMQGNGKKAPPGFYAHLGMLYAEAGDDTQAVACFETEKANFPESAAFMDYFLKKYGR